MTVLGDSKEVGTWKDRDGLKKMLQHSSDMRFYCHGRNKH